MTACRWADAGGREVIAGAWTETVRSRPSASRCAGVAGSAGGTTVVSASRGLVDPERRRAGVEREYGGRTGSRL